MEKRSPLVHELYSSLELPAYIHAYIDLYTGLIRLNCDMEMLPKLVDNIPESHILMPEALFHELQHFIQFSFLGYLYKHATTVDLIIKESYPKEITSFKDLPRKAKNESMLYSVQCDLHRKLESTISVYSITEGVTLEIPKLADHLISFCIDHQFRRCLTTRFRVHLITHSLGNQCISLVSAAFTL